MSFSTGTRNNEESSAVSHQYDKILLFGQGSRHVARLSSADYKVTLVGSKASGADIRGSDEDYMIEPRNIIIEESSILYREDIPCYVRIPTNALPGLVPRELVGDAEYMRADIFREETVEKLNFMTNEISNVGKINVQQERSTDFVPQLKISGLPRTAGSFTTRVRSWPSDDIVSLIKTGEFHLVARPAPTNPDPEHDFCLSFSKAEVVLTRTMSVNQVLSIKMLNKIGCLINGERKVLKSYIMKTVALWFFEKTDIRVWENDRPVISILVKLHQYLAKRFLPHYFVYRMNLFSGVSGSDLEYVQLRLSYFLGYHLITDDIPGISSYIKLIVAFHIMSNAKPDSHVLVYKIGFQYLNTGNVPDHPVKQMLSAKVIRQVPVYVTRRVYNSEVDSCRLPFNELADGWLSSQNMEPSVCDLVEWVIDMVVKSVTEPLDLFFGMKIEENVCGIRIVERSTQSEHSMKKWLAIIDDMIKKLKTIADNLLDGMSHRSRYLSCTSSDWFMADSCTLLDEATKELLAFAIDNIDVDLLRQAQVGDSPENIYMLYDAIEVLFLPIEYDIVRSIRSKPSAWSFTPDTLEYRCVEAFIIAKKMMKMFDNFQLIELTYNGYLRFMATAIRGEYEHRT